MERLQEKYKSEIAPAMKEKFNYSSVMEIPKLEKIVLNMGVGEVKENAKALESAIKDMEMITGQKAIVTKAKKAIATFKIRQGMNIGCKVTLRVNPISSDGRGNDSMGVKEQLIFPEIEYDKVDKIRGMDIIFVTTAKTDVEAKELLTMFGMPFAG